MMFVYDLYYVKFTLLQFFLLGGGGGAEMIINFKEKENILGNLKQKPSNEFQGELTLQKYYDQQN